MTTVALIATRNLDLKPRSRPLIDTSTIRKHHKLFISTRSEFLIDTNFGDFRTKVFRRRWGSLRTNYYSPVTFLIDSLPIRIRPNPKALNKNPISNRQQKGTFLTILHPPRAMKTKGGHNF